MDFLNKEYIDAINKKKQLLENTYNQLIEVETSLKNERLTGDEYELLYGKEFSLCVKLSGVYNDLDLMLKELYNQVPEQRFFVNRVQSEMQLYKIWETIDI